MEFILYLESRLRLSTVISNQSSKKELNRDFDLIKMSIILVLIRKKSWIIKKKIKLTEYTEQGLSIKFIFALDLSL